MRKENFSVGSYVHVMKRGVRRTNIVRDEADRWRFLKLIRYLNDSNVPRNWERDITPDHIREGFKRPEGWGKSDPYVSVLAYCLMDNHFHLLLQERVDGGIGKFMQRVCTSMAAYFNAKYAESGSLFQGAYKARTVRSDTQLQYLAAYINVKNPFERYPAGFDHATSEFDKAFRWAEEDPFSSLSDYVQKSHSALLDHAAIIELFDHGQGFKEFSKDVIQGRELIDDEEVLMID